MKFKLTLTNNMTYSEVGQKNPLRWKTLLRDGDNFTDQSGWIKCKDFYNDTVAFFKEGTVFSIWGYQNNIQKNPEGVYFLLKYVTDKSTFFKNMEVMNTQMMKDLKCKVDFWDHDADEVIILIPNEMWESTYRISMVTMVIRLCNWGELYKTWEEFWNKDAASYKFDSPFTEDAKINARKYGFGLPAKFSKFWWYCGPKYNNEVVKGAKGGMIHNNGCSNWSQFMKENV